MKNTMKAIIFFLSHFLLTLAANDFSVGTKLFSADVYNELISEDDNFLISPFSLETVLALTQSGGVAKTSQEIRHTLHLPETEEKTEELVKTALSDLQNEDYTLQSANKIYVKENYEIRDEFKKVARDVYQSDIENIEFSENIKAANTINEWVEEQTHNKIHDLVSPDDLDDDSRLVLVNALYFQANWKEPFLPSFTAKQKFFLSDESSVEAETMYQYSIPHKYYESEELDSQFLEIDLEGDASITFVLPKKKDGLAALEKQKKMILETPKYVLTEVLVALPKFKVETSVDFNKVLQNLGIHDAFSAGVADFSGIAGEKGDLHIQKVLQKSFISVDENGIEAAAATSADMSIRSQALQFKADHPFLFYIKVKDVILFEGRVLKPEY